MIQVAQPADPKEILLEVPVEPIHRVRVYNRAAPQKMQPDYFAEDLIAINYRLTSVLESLCTVCESTLRELSAADYDRVINYLTAALENSARIATLLGERDRTF
jgi:hypothetical protein